jgi:tetratricopeptide (TPR) repeat protein
MFSDKTIEEYQQLLLRNPTAKVFAPLAEAYRKMGLLQQALEICERGIKYHPDYPSGLVAYGKILFEMKKYHEATQAFAKATSLKPDNILAHKLSALSFIKLNKFPEALKAYKHVLYLSPKDPQAQKFIENWEYLEAPQYSEKTFAIPPKEEGDLLAQSTPQHVSNFIEALILRNEIKRAQTIISTALEIWPDTPLLLKQRQAIEEFEHEESQEQTKILWQRNQIKKKFLTRLLRRIEHVKKVDLRHTNPFNT